MRRAPVTRALARFCLSTLCVATLGVSSLSLSGCAALMRQQPASEPATSVSLQGVQDIDVAEAQDLSRMGVTVIDVREPHEYQEGHIPGARNLPLGSLDSWAQELDPAGAYVLICRSGVRSTKAKQGLEAKGFKNLRNVKGGMRAWEAQGAPMSQPSPR